MANTLRFKRGLASGIPTALAGEPLFTTDTFDLYIGNGTTNTRFQKYIASGATTQILRGDGSLYTFPLAISSPSNGQVLKYNGTSWVNDSDAGLTGSGTTNYLPKFTGASTLGNSLVFENANGIGIGTTVASSSSAVRMLINSSTGGFIGFGFSGNGGGAVGSPSSSELAFYTATGTLGSETYSQRARIPSTGNFIINNASVDNGLRFQVTGDGYFSGSVGIGTSTLTTSLTLGSGTTGLSFQSANTSLNSGKIAVIRPIEVGSGNGHLVFETYQGGAGGGVRMYLDSSGNLGLGATPSAWISSYKPIQIGFGSAISGRTDNTQTMMFSNAYRASDGTHYYIRSSENATQYLMNLSGNHIWYNAPSGTAGNAITFTQAMTLDASGNLGIGATIPSYKLHVNGKIYSSTEVQGGSALMNLTGAYATFGSNSGSTGIRIGRDAFYDDIIINSTGNVTLGSTSDSGEKLQVNGTAKITGNLAVDTNTLFVDATNNRVGIGTANPDNILHLVGGNSINSTLKIQASNYPMIDFISDDASSGNRNWRIASVYNTYGTFEILSSTTAGGTPTTSRFSITNDGNVGIGITPTEKLHVSGNAIVTGNLTVDSSTFFVDATANEVGIGTNAPNSTLHVSGSVTTAIVAKTANYTATVSDYTILCDTTGGGFTITLPAANTCTGRIYVIKKVIGNSGLNNVTIDGNGAETIDGAATLILQCKSSAMIQSDGANWYILALYSDASCL